MARNMTVVDKDVLIKAIETVEANGAVANRKTLFDKVSKEYKTLTTNDVSAPVIASRIESFGLEVKTPKGKPGRPKSVATVTETKSVETTIVSTETNTSEPVSETVTIPAETIAAPVAIPVETVTAESTDLSGNVVTEEIPVMTPATSEAEVVA